MPVGMPLQRHVLVGVVVKVGLDGGDVLATDDDEPGVAAVLLGDESRLFSLENFSDAP